MEAMIAKYLMELDVGEAQHHKNMTVFPVFAPSGGEPEYLTLNEALDQGHLTITEVSPDGEVPALKVLNQAEVPVLLLDGEELAGAKQNRVLNTSVLIAANSKTVIPVSCTEQGRWSYSSNEFASSGVVMAHSVRVCKSASVAKSLRIARGHEAEQHEIWDGNAEGLDIISMKSAYKVLHPKLIKSYAMDALLSGSSKDSKADADTASSFIAAAADCLAKKYDSVGLGHDIRFDGRRIVGSALVHEQRVVHVAAFSATQADRAGSMSGPRTRRGFRL